MQIFIDGRDDVLLVEGPTKFVELLDELDQMCSDAKRIINEIKINGVLIAPGDIHKYLDKDLSDFELVEIETVGEVEAALEELVKANSMVLELMDMIRLFIDSGAMSYHEIVMNVINVMNSWENICRKIDECARTLNVDYTNLRFSDIDFHIQHKKSLEIIEKLSEALSSKNVTVVRDILEYEFLPQMQSYSHFIEAIVKKFEEQWGKDNG